MLPLPRPWLEALLMVAGALALVQTLRLWARAAAVRWRLRAQSARAAAGEVQAAQLLARRGFALEARQASRRWQVSVDGTTVEVALRADYLVRRGGRRFVAEVKTGAAAPLIAAPATRRQLLEYRCAFDVDGVLLVDAETGTVQEIDFALPALSPRRARWRPLLIFFFVVLALGAALGGAAVRAVAPAPPLRHR
jgi:hypothetical protein